MRRAQANAARTAVLEARDLKVTIGGITVVNELNLVLTAGQSIGILGPNGVGKTTLLLTLAGVRAPFSGEVRLGGHDIRRQPRRQVARQLGMLTQNTRFAFDAGCLEVALAGRHPHLGALQSESTRDRDIAVQALQRVGLADKLERSCLQLSGGEQRRLALARVLAQDPDVLLADEPTNHLDPAHRVAILDQLWRRLHARPGAQLLALHDINLATCYCTDVLMLFGNGQYEYGPTDQMLTEHRLSRLFGCPIRAVTDGRQTVFAVAGNG
ncbi:MAG: ABC transporter ATP-binding protein [Wenzhouxiangellaceae bacterium]|nr:ABC transporter ATP-binding protein [Wenzhouxiangellaceae bacterium]